MQPTSLLFPGDSEGTIRREVAAAISRLEIAAQTSTVSDTFAKFLYDAATKCPGFSNPTGNVTDGEIVVIGPVHQPIGDMGVQLNVSAGKVQSARLLGSANTIISNGDTISVETPDGPRYGIVTVVGGRASVTLNAQ